MNYIEKLNEMHTKDIDNMSLKELKTELTYIGYKYPNFPKLASNEMIDRYEKIKNFIEFRKYIRINFDEEYRNLTPIEDEDDDEGEEGESSQANKMIIDIPIRKIKMRK